MRIMHHMIRLGLCALLLAMTAGCLSLKQAKEMQAEIDALKAEQEVMQRSLTEREAKMAEMIAEAKRENDALKKRIKEAQEMLAKNDAETGVDLDQVRRDLNDLRGKSEELEFKLQRMDQEIVIFKEDVDLRIAGAVESIDLPDNATDLLELGKSKLSEGETRSARKIFETFLSRYPKDARADEATYYLGESYYDEEQYISAIYEYRKVFEKYERSRLRPDAILRVGQSFEKMGKCEQAKTFLEVVATTFSKSKAAKIAREEMENGCEESS